jgi:PAS domain S-box-containing protein
VNVRAVPGEGGETGALLRAKDWTATPLGDPDGWPEPLKTLVSIMLGSDQAMFTAWGPERVLLYNDRYAELLQDRHPAAFGRSFAEVWHDIMDAVGPILDEAYAGRSTHMDDIEFALLRGGRPQEAHFSFSYTPVRDGTGAVAGVFCACTEITEQVAAQRATALRAELGDTLRALNDPEEIAAAAARLLGEALQVDGVGFAEVEQGGETAVVERDWTAPGFVGVVGVHPLDAYGPELKAEMQAGRTVRIADVAIDPRSASGAAAYEAIALRAYVDAPVLRDGELVGILFVLSRTPRVWTDQEAALIEEFAARTWSAIHRRRAEAALRESEARHAFLLDLGDELRRLTEPAAIVAATARALGQRLDVARVAYAEVDEARDLATVLGEWTCDASSLPPEVRVSDFGPTLLARLRAGGVLAVDDVARHPTTQEALPALEAIGVGALVSVPLVKDGRFLVNLNVHERRPRAWTADEVRLIETTAERAWEAVERARTDAAVREREERLRLVQAAGGIGSFEWHVPSGRVHRSPEYLALHGLPADAPLATPYSDAWLDRVHPDDRDRVRSWFEDDLARGGPFKREYRIVRADDGETRWINNRGRIDLDADGRPLRLLSAQTDTTERKRGEAALLESRAELQTMADALPVLISFVDKDERYRFNNRAYEAWFGHPRETLYGRTVREVLGEAAYAGLKPNIDRALAGERVSLEQRVPYKDGGTRDVHVDYVPRRGEGGAVEGWYALVRDVSDRVRAEASVRESEARLRSVVLASPFPIMLHAEDGEVLELSRKWTELTGYAREQIRTHDDWFRLAYPHDAERYRALVAEEFAHEGEIAAGEHAIRTADGGRRIWDFYNVGLGRLPDGRRLQVSAAADVTERKDAEERLRESERRFRAAVDAVRGVLWTNDAEGRMTGEQPGWAALTGQTREEYEGYGWAKAVHPEDAETTLAAWKEAVAERTIFIFEHRLRTAAGEWRRYAIRAVPVLGEDGRVREWVGVHTDVTAQREAEDALRDSEARLRFMSGLEEALRRSPAAPNAMLAAAEQLARRLDVSRCAYADVDADNDRFVIRDDWTAPGVASSAGTYSLDLFGPRAAADMREGRVLVVRDVAGELAEGEGREAFLSIGIQAIVCCPLVRDGRLVAMMAVHHEEPRDWRDDEIDLVRAAVERCWAHVERTGAEARLLDSEARQRIAAEAAGLGVFEWRISDDVALWENARMYELFGHTVEDGTVSRAAFFDAYLHPDDAKAFGSALQAGMEPGAVFHALCRIRRKSDGELRWLEFTGRFGHDPDGAPQSLVGVIADVTDRKAAEERLREQEEQFRTLADNIPTLCWTAYADGHIFWYNRRWYEYTGTSPDDQEGWGWVSVHDPDCLPDVERRWRRSLATGEPFEMVFPLKGADGAFRPFLTRIVPIRDESGEIVRWFGTNMDISVQRATEEALQALNETLESRVQERTRELIAAEEALRQAQKMEAIGQLTGGVAHDFNNLLTVIRSSADLLRRRELPEERRRRYVDAISDTADRAAKLTGQLLAFARRQALKPEPFDVGSRVEGIAEMLKTVLGARVTLELQAEPGLAVEADPAQFETALVNMAVNARDAMDGEGRLTVTVSPDGEGFVAVTVEDTGPGVPADALPRIFEPFFTTKDLGKGTGLGLSQVYGFAKQSGGEIAVRSEPGRGAAFTLTLPRVSADRLPTACPRPRPEGTAQGQGRVLVVEDNAQVGEFACQLLNDLGYLTTHAADAQEALKLLDKDGAAFDLVFSDVVMPGMGGVELGRLVRERHPGLPVVLTSGYSHVLAEDARHGFPLLHKPYSVEELSRVLRRAGAQA